MSGLHARAARRAGPGWRVTLLDLYLARLLAARLALGLGLVFTVMMLERALRLATQMAAAGAHMGFLPEMIWNLVPHYVGLALPAAFLIGLLMTVSRLEEGLEIEAMLAAGISLRRILTVLVTAGVVVGAAGLVVIGWLEPHGLFGYRSAREEALRAGWTARAQPWAFQGRGGDITLTADETDAGGHALRGVLIVRRAASGAESVLTAGQATLRLGPDGRTAALDAGRGRFLVDLPGRTVSTGAFDSYSLSDPFPAREARRVRGTVAAELTLDELARDLRPRDRRAEFCARVAWVLSAVMAPFLALPMALAGRRGRPLLGMLVAGVLTMGFHLQLRLVQSLGAQGRIEPLNATLGAFAVALPLLAWLFLSNRRLLGDTPLARFLRRLQQFLAPPRPPPTFEARAHATVAGYVRRSLFVSIVWVALAMVSLLGMIDLCERTGAIMSRGFGLPGLARYAALRAPILAEQSLGLITLIGAAAAFARLVTGGEITAIRSLGVSLYQMTRMVLPVGLAMAAASILLSEVAAPAAQLGLARWWSAEGTQGAQGAQGTMSWFRTGGEVVNVAALSADGERLGGVRIYRRGADGLLAERVVARAASASGNTWTLEDAMTSRVEANAARQAWAPSARWPAAMTPAELSAAAAGPLQISARSAWRAASGAAPTNLSRGFLVTRLNRALTEPLVPMIMLVMALPLALSPARTGPSFPRLVWVLGGGLVFVVVDGICLACGQTGLAPPAWAAWCAPTIFTGLALIALVWREA
ncbi:MAG: LptF/LptG family permease [Proteobacteria bacterium]|nr:LptF/LptG family permease [Pseudomonadota bacterium]